MQALEKAKYRNQNRDSLARTLSKPVNSQRRMDKAANLSLQHPDEFR